MSAPTVPLCSEIRSEKFGEAAVALRRRRHRRHPRARLLDQAALVVGEPERLAADDRTAGGEAELVRQVLALLDAGAVGEEVVGVQRVVAVELPHAAAELVGARLERRVEHRAAGAPVLGAERARQDLDLVDRVDRRLDDVGDAAQEVDVAGVVVDAVEQVVVLRRAGRRWRRTSAARARRAAAARRRREPREDRVVAAVDRQVFDGRRT